jgi:hypothetical protein
MYCKCSQNILALKRIFLSINMFDGLGYGTIIKHEIMRIVHDTKIICRCIRECDLYMLDGSNIIKHAHVFSQVLHSIVELCNFWL